MKKHITFIIIFLIANINIFAGQGLSPKVEQVKSEEIISSERISLDLKGVDIIELFRVLSLKTGTTIVPSKRVVGRINVFLNNVTFEDVLDVILVSQGLAVEEKGNILFIMTNDEYKRIYGREYIENREYKNFKLQYAKPTTIFGVLSEIKSEIGKVVVDQDSGTVILIDVADKLDLMEQVIKDLDQPLKTVIFDLNYGDPEEVKTHIASVITPGLGEVIVDVRSRKLIVSDLPAKIEKIKKIVEAIDEESRQVLIEAVIIQVIFDDHSQRGIDWQKIFNDKNFGDVDFVGDFSVSPTLSSYQNVSVGTVPTDKYNATLQFLQTYGDTKILSRPRIAVLNNEEAKIMVGSREAYVTQSLSQSDTTVTSESIEFIDVGVKLSVTPTINKEGFITMKIKPEVSSVGDILPTASGGTIPIVDTSEAETVVKVKDGTMIMIAGLIKEQYKDDRIGTPFFSKLPIIGYLFGGRDKQKQTTELVILITPRIISGEESISSLELGKRIPHDIMPEDFKKQIILQELNNIGDLKREKTDTIKKQIQRKSKDLKN